MSTFRRAVLSILPVLLGLAAPWPSVAATTPAQRCVMRKLDATARAVVAHVACEARALRRGLAPPPSCHGDADERLDAAFDRIEGRGGCVRVGDGGAVDALIDGLVEVILDGAGNGACGAAKARASARKVFGDLACAREGVRRGGAPDPGCEQAKSAKLAQIFAQAERRFACTNVGDAGVVDAAVTPLRAALAELLIVGPPAVDPKPSGLTATVDGVLVKLAWTAPAAASGNTHVRIVRRLNAPPIAADDPAATSVFFGTATQASESTTGLLPTTGDATRTYHYAAFGCTAAAVCETAGSRTTLGLSLLQALRGGGYVLHWRHAAATVCADRTDLGTAATTASPDWWKSCDANCGTTATARQLDASGVEQATAIGQAFDTLAIPVGRVISSEFCRNLTTAELMDFGPTIETDQGVTYFVYDEAGRCDASYALIETVPAAGTNTAIVGHSGFSGTCPVLGQLAWGEAAIFKPDGLGDAVLVTRVLATDWATLP